MTVTTVNIVCDIGLSDNTEFTAARLDFTPSGPDYDTVSNDSIPAVTVSVDLDASGTGTAALWPVTRGTQNTTYAVSVIGTRIENGQTVARAYSLGRIAPPEAGAPHNLADLLSQSAGGIEAGSTIYATLADAVAAAVAAANQAELIAGGVLDDDLLPLEHASRAALVSAVSGGLSIVNGFTYRAGGVSYIGSTGATAIADLPGLVPNKDVTPQIYGAVGDGAADDTAALNAALATGQRVVYYRPHRITGPLVFADNSELVAHGEAAEIINASATTGLIIDMLGCVGATLKGGKITGNKTSVSGQVSVRMDGAQSCTVSGVAFADLSGPVSPGSISMRGAVDCEISDCQLIDCGGSGIVLDVDPSFVVRATGNRILRNTFHDCGGFGVLLRSGSDRNLVEANHCTSNAFEVIGIQHGSDYNRIIGNHCEGTGDNGISVSADHNIVANNVCRYNNRAGIHVWGSFNTIIGNTCVGNDQEFDVVIWAGIGISANYGGGGQYNIVAGNIIDDDQAVPTQRNGIRFAGSSYVAWAAGQTIDTSSGNVYRLNGLNLYIATTSGTTGATAPIHTSGTVSDGGVSWRYQSTFFDTATPNKNRAWDNQIIRIAAGGNKIVDATANGENWWSTDVSSRMLGTLDVRGNLQVAGSPVYARNTILGAVSQSAGVPTGAIIQRGSAATGEWVRFADGTQIVTRSDLVAGAISTADGALFKTASDLTFTLFPIFATPPVIVGGVVSDPDVFITPVGSAAGTGTVRPRSTVSKGPGVVYGFTAIGRWF